MSTLNSFFHPPVERVRRWLHPDPTSHTAPVWGPGVDLTPNPGHAPGHRHLGPPAPVPGPHVTTPPPQQHHQAWRDTGGRVDRLRRNERHGDEGKE